MALLQAFFPVMVFWLAQIIPSRWTAWRLTIKKRLKKALTKKDKTCSA
jgi:putative thiamine transport system permease protein